jgi:DNA repair photolyase
MSDSESRAGKYGADTTRVNDGDIESDTGAPRRHQIKGRGANLNERQRFESWQRESDATRDEADAAHESVVTFRTTVTEQHARSIISRNVSPDVGFDRSINPYQGCEHGCVYCFARPTHAYLGLSPGLDFETQLFAKVNAAELLRDVLSKKGYQPAVMALGANTDPYQPIERDHKITRAVLEVLEAFQHPVGITTKSASVVRDIDILERMAKKDLVRVYLSVATLDRDVARLLEPRASTPSRRIEAIRALTAAGVPTGVLVAPIVPALTDFDIENVLKTASEAGAQSAGYVMLRLPLEVRDLFVTWLETHFPMRARHVMSLIEQVRDGKHYDATFGQRMRGTGNFATLVAQRFQIACRRYEMNQARRPLRTDLFSVPPEMARRAPSSSRSGGATSATSAASPAQASGTASCPFRTGSGLNPQLDLF